MSGSAAQPSRIGAYTLLRHLATDNGVDIYLAQQVGPLGFARVCEMKVLAAGQGSAGVGRDLAREASICARLKHPSILHVFDFFEHDGRLALVTEHVDGVTLEQVLERSRQEGRRLDERAIVYLGHELFGALAAAHGGIDDDGEPHPVIHRNVHPGNVIISWDGGVYLAGFGLARILEPAGDDRVSALAFAAGYAAPEQGRGDRLTAKTDLYSAAAIVWSLLTGREPPLTGERPQELSNFGLSIPREIAAAIDASLEPNPERRTLSCKDLRRWFERAAQVEAGRPRLAREVERFRATAEPLPRLTPVDEATDSTWMAPAPPKPPSLSVPSSSTAPRFSVSERIRGSRAIRLAAGALLVGAAIGASVSWVAASSAGQHAETLQATPAAAAIEVAREVSKQAAAAAQAPTPAAAPKPAAAPTPPPPAPSPSTPLPKPPPRSRAATFSHVTVATTAPGQVFVNDTLVGPVNKKFEIPCGPWFMRVGVANKDGTPHRWLGEGRWVEVECGAKNQIVRNVPPGAPAKPAKTAKAGAKTNGKNAR